MNIRKMDHKPLKTNENKTRPAIILSIGLVLFIGLVWMLVVRFEGENPSLEFTPLSFISTSQPISLTIADEKSGLRQVWIGLLKDGKESVLFDKHYPKGSLFRGGLTRKDPIDLQVEPKKLDISDGQAMLRIVIKDYSWKSWGKGNTTYKEIPVAIDTQPPEVEILTSAHNINQGGAGLVIYRLSENSPRHGVSLNGNFFPGHTGHFKNNLVAMAFIALDIELPDQTEMFVTASDMAGNSARAEFLYYLRKQSFKSDAVQLTDGFLNSKMPELMIDVPADSETSMIEKFLKVNRELRQENHKEFSKIGETTDHALYWSTEFMRLPRSSPEAGFADVRDYHYQGQKIDRQTHLGIDLASLAHSPVPAANRGKVAFVGTIGIYGKTVAIDHGFGIFSTYSHLSGHNVEKGQMVEKGGIIGRTGTTGMAGGDHLHFGILIHNRFVNPIEWWDPHWIKDNIQDKIETITSLYP